MPGGEFGEVDGAVRADAAALPFAAGIFDVVVANHSVEHFARLRDSIEEKARVLKPGGVIYVTVPDASTWSDRVYRWLGRGGGHVNPFREVGELPGLVEEWTGLRLGGWKVLYSGYSFLNRRNCARMPRRSYLLGGGAVVRRVVRDEIERVWVGVRVRPGRRLRP